MSSLDEKLASIYKTIDHIPKNGEYHVGSTRYKYTKAVDMVTAVRRQLLDLKVYAEVNFEHLQSFTITRREPVPFDAHLVRCTVVFHDVASQETRTGSGLGIGCDLGDKAIYKAQTGAMKYALRNAFLVPDEASDPEGDPTTDPNYDPAGMAYYDDFGSGDIASVPAVTGLPAAAAPPSSTPTKAAQPPKADIPAQMSPATTAAPKPWPEPTPEPATISNALPTKAQLDEFKENFKKLSHDLMSKTKIKAGDSKTVNDKIIVFMLKFSGAESPKSMTFAQWVAFLAKVNTLRLTGEGLNQLASEIEEANKQ